MALPVSPVCDNRYPVAPPVVPPTEPPSGGGGGAARPKNTPLTRDLVAWWNMDSAVSDSGETDSLGNYNLTSSGAGALSFDTTDYRTGGVSRVFASGSANYFNYSGAAPADLRTDGDFTFFIFAKPNDTTTRDVCGVWTETGDQRGWRIVHNSTGWRVEISDDGTAAGITSIQSTTGGTDWAFICVTRKGGTLSLYVNGGAAQTATITGIHASTAEFRIGDVVDGDGAPFTQGGVDQCGMWTRALKSREINERATSLYAGGAGYAYADIGDAFGYSSLSAAESSGDNWKEGNVVRVAFATGVVDFVYFAALAVDGHSGLVHRYPFDDANEAVSVGNVDFSIAANTDLESTGDVDTSVATGTDGVDWAIDIDSSRMRFRDLSPSGICRADTNAKVGGSGEVVYLIADDVNGLVPGVQLTMLGFLQIGANGGDSNDHYIRVGMRGQGTAANFQSASGATLSTYTDLGVDQTVQTRFWIYIKANKWSVWLDTSVSPAATGVDTFTAAHDANAQRLTYWAGQTARSGDVFRSGYTITGPMTTA